MNGELPNSIYDISLASADGSETNILASLRGKVTLIFNCAAGCGNAPQHLILEELNQRYINEPDFNILAITVDDFMCHGYEEFQDGLESYINKNKLMITPGQVAQQYAVNNFNTTYKFTELTNGRYDKHKYDSSFVSGALKEQEMHPLWFLLTGAYLADISDNGIPFHREDIPWSDSSPMDLPAGAISFTPLTGNFDKFLVDRTGKKIKRYANSFLLGERDHSGRPFPWVSIKEIRPGVPEYRPNHAEKDGGAENNGPFPTPLQRRGIDISLDYICKDIDEFLGCR